MIEFVDIIARKFQKEWHLIKGAPFSFIMLCALVSVASFYAVQLFYERELSAIERENELLKTQLGKVVDGAINELPKPEIEALLQSAFNTPNYSVDFVDAKTEQADSGLYLVSRSVMVRYVDLPKTLTITINGGDVHDAWIETFDLEQKVVSKPRREDGTLYLDIEYPEDAYKLKMLAKSPSDIRLGHEFIR